MFREFWAYHCESSASVATSKALEATAGGDMCNQCICDVLRKPNTHFTLAQYIDQTCYMKTGVADVEVYIEAVVGYGSMLRQWLWIGFEKAASPLPWNAPQSVRSKVRNLDCESVCPASPPDDSSSNVLRGLVSVSFGGFYQDRCTPGWTEQAHFLREHCLANALDAVQVRVHESHFFPAWESMPHLLKRARVSHRDAGRSRSVKVVPKFSAGVVSIEQWCLLEETDREAVSRATVNLCLQRGLVGQLTSVGSVIGGESAGAEPNLADDDLSDFPVLFVPPWLGQCIFTKQWHDLVMLGRWAHQCPKLEEFLPPQNAGASMPAQPACLTAEAAERCVELLRDAFAKLSISLSDEDQVAGLRLDTLRCIEDLSAHRDSLVPDSAHVRLFDKVTKESSFLRQILASLDLKNRGKLKQHARKFIECIPEGLRPGATAWVQSAFASSSKLCRGRLQLDIAMLLFQRARVQAKGSVLRYMWGDATTKRPWEIYNVRYRMCRSAEVISLARAFKWLCAHPAASEDSAALPEDVQAQRCVYSQLLFDSFELHTQVPQLLGQGRTKLIDKVSAHVQSGLLEAGDLEGLQAYLSSCVAWCSDMGVEAGIPDCEVQCIESVLPPCVRPSRLHICNTEDENFADEGLLTAEPERARESTLMPDAIHVPGTCHAIHNACLNLDTALSDIDWFIASVKKLHPLFSVKRRRDRFLHVALHGTPQYDQGKQILESFSGTLHTERWGELAGYLRTAYPLLLFCRQYWDGVAYARGLDDGGETEEFSCSAITEVLKDDYFLVYWQLQIALRDMIQHLLRWVEGCACHSNLLQGKSAFGQEQALREEIQCPGEVTCQCPLMGCQAAGLVAGHMERRLQRLLHRLGLMISCRRILQLCPRNSGVGWLQNGTKEGCTFMKISRSDLHTCRLCPGSFLVELIRIQSCRKAACAKHSGFGMSCLRRRKSSSTIRPSTCSRSARCEPISNGTCFLMLRYRTVRCWKPFLPR